MLKTSDLSKVLLLSSLALSVSAEMLFRLDGTPPNQSTDHAISIDLPDVVITELDSNPDKNAIQVANSKPKKSSTSETPEEDLTFETSEITENTDNSEPISNQDSEIHAVKEARIEAIHKDMNTLVQRKSITKGIIGGVATGVITGHPVGVLVGGFAGVLTGRSGRYEEAEEKAYLMEIEVRNSTDLYYTEDEIRLAKILGKELNSEYIRKEEPTPKTTSKPKNQFTLNNCQLFQGSQPEQKSTELEPSKKPPESSDFVRLDTEDFFIEADSTKKMASTSPPPKPLDPLTKRRLMSKHCFYSMH